jgi:hypothetical protein
MKSYESTPTADQCVRRDAAEQLSGDWNSRIVNFDGPSFLEYDRVGVARPLVMSARRALVRSARRVKRLADSPEVVPVSVLDHTGIIHTPMTYV